MGRASRKKQDTPERRLKEKRCLHCGGGRDTGHVWCRRCVISARRRGRENGYPTIKPPVSAGNQHLYHWLRMNFWNIDPRYRWPMVVEVSGAAPESEGPPHAASPPVETVLTPVLPSEMSLGTPLPS